MKSSVLLEVKNLKKKFVVSNNFRKKKYVRAVDDVSFSIAKGKTLGLVGESGCGKSTLARTLLRLLEPESGRIFFAGEDITHVNMRPYRKKMQIVFQDPAGSLDPRTRICDSIAEGMLIHHIGTSKQERLERVL
jgi:oligopeptide transport system ATP-binding protein